MDYDYITTCNWTSTGTFTLRAYRGSAMNVVTSYPLYYRKKGSPTWITTNNGQVNISSTGEWEIANNWNKSGNNVLHHSYYGITAINRCTNIYMNEAGLGSAVGDCFLMMAWGNCSNLLEMPVGFNLPSGITSVGADFLNLAWGNCTKLTSMPSVFTIPSGITTIGNYFLANTWQRCNALTTMPHGFNLPSGIETIPAGFLSYTWEGCSSLVAMPYGFNLPSSATSVGNGFLYMAWMSCPNLSSLPPEFNIPSGITSVGADFMMATWYACSSLSASGYTEDMIFEFNAVYVFQDTLVTPGSVSGASKETPVHRAIKRTPYYKLTWQLDGDNEDRVSYFAKWVDLDRLIFENRAELTKALITTVEGIGTPPAPTSFAQLFEYCIKLEEVEFNGIDTSSVATMERMFGDAHKLKGVDFTDWDVSSCTSFTNMFHRCYDLESAIVPFKNTQNVMTMMYAFGYCESLTTLDLSSWNTSGLLAPAMMFLGCENLVTIYVSELWTNSSVTYSLGMFMDCLSIVGAVSYNPSKIDHQMANYTTGYFTYKPPPPEMSNRKLWVKGRDVGSSERDIFTIGFDMDTSERGLYVIGKIVETSQRGLYVIGQVDGFNKYKNLKLGLDNSSLRNRVYVRGGTYLSDETTIKIVADGEQTVFNLPEKPHEAKVYEDDEPKSVGIKHIEDFENFDYLMSYQEKYIETETAPAEGTVIKVEFKYDIPVLVAVEDRDSIEKYGQFEYVIFDKDISTITEARERAVAELTDYAESITSGTFQTDYPGFRAGQFLNVILPDLGIDEKFIVKSVKATSYGGGGFSYSISITSTEMLGIIQFLVNLLEQDKNALNITTDEVVDEITTISRESYTLVDSEPVVTTHDKAFEWDDTEWDIGEWYPT